MSGRFVRTGPAPDAMSVHLVLKKHTSPELLGWAWAHPYAVQHIIRAALTQCLADGTLDRIEQEVSHATGTMHASGSGS